MHTFNGQFTEPDKGILSKWKETFLRIWKLCYSGPFICSETSMLILVWWSGLDWESTPVSTENHFLLTAFAFTGVYSEKHCQDQEHILDWDPMPTFPKIEVTRLSLIVYLCMSNTICSLAAFFLKKALMVTLACQSAFPSHTSFGREQLTHSLWLCKLPLDAIYNLKLCDSIQWELYTPALKEVQYKNYSYTLRDLSPQVKVLIYVQIRHCTIWCTDTHISSPWNSPSPSKACRDASLSRLFFSFFSFFDKVRLKFWITPSFSCFSGPLLWAFWNKQCLVLWSTATLTTLISK